MSKDLKIAFLGLGTMGLRMAERIRAAGYDLSVYNRTASKAEALGQQGAFVAATPAAASRGRDVVIVMVSDTADVGHVVFGPDGAAEGLGAGTVVIDMSTISPNATREYAARVSEIGVDWLDAPVSGGSEGAEQGTLSIMAGGEAAVLARVRPLLEVLGSTI